MYTYLDYFQYCANPWTASKKLWYAELPLNCFSNSRMASSSVKCKQNFSCNCSCTFLCFTFGIFASLISDTKFRMRLALFLRIEKAMKQSC